MAAEDNTFPTKGERQARVLTLYVEGLSQTRICDLLGVSLRAIVRDCAELELKLWSEVAELSSKRYFLNACSDRLDYSSLYVSSA